jgi:PKD repeat protein
MPRRIHRKNREEARSIECRAQFFVLFFSFIVFFCVAMNANGERGAAITSPTTASGTVGTAFSYQITATNSPSSYGATGFPAGLTVNSRTGLLSGTPTAAGISSVALSATTRSGTAKATLTLTITLPAPVITSPTSVSGTVGSAFTYQITATNSPTSYGATGLAAGLAVNTTTGLISGAPTAAGTSTVTLGASNSAGTGKATLTVTVALPAPAITSATTASGTAGSAFTYQITATN